MQGIFARTKSKFWSLKHLFRAKTPLSGRLRLMHRVLGGTALWCAGASLPNSKLLSQLVCWAMRLSKGAAEPWVEYKVRCLRSARNAIHLHMRDRWSTLWLRRSWDYCGHRARAKHWDVVPGCSILDSFRSLAWWEEQQGLCGGQRHKGRFFPRLMNEERALNHAAKGDLEGAGSGQGTVGYSTERLDLTGRSPVGLP